MKIYTLFVAALVLLFSSGVSAATVSGYETASVSLRPLGSDTFVKVGYETEIGKFQLRNTSDRKLFLQNITWYNYGRGSLEERFENLHVTINGRDTDVQTSAQGRYLTLHFPYGVEIGRGDTVLVRMLGQVAYARRGDTVQLGIRQETDLDIIEVSSGFAVNHDARAQRLAVLRLNPGDIRVSNSSYRAQNLANTNRIYRRATRTESYNPGSRDVVFLNQYLNTNRHIVTEGVFLPIKSNTSVTDHNGNGALDIEDLEISFDDFRLYVNGALQDSTNGFSVQNGTVGLLFDSGFDILSPYVQVLVTGRVTNDAQEGDRIAFTLDVRNLIDPVYADTGEGLY